MIKNIATRYKGTINEVIKSYVDDEFTLNIKMENEDGEMWNLYVSSGQRTLGQWTEVWLHDYCGDKQAMWTGSKMHSIQERKEREK